MRATAAAWSGVRMPKPTPTGSLVWRLMRSTWVRTASSVAELVPVMPSTETK